jgi:hypothetical protein
VSTGEVYRLHVWLRGISPLISRRLLVRSDHSIADLHYTLQIAFGWTDSHLHRFRIHGKNYGVAIRGGPSFADDARRIHVGDFHLRVNERFLYEYDFGDGWQHEVRVEGHLPVDDKRIYPVCIGGRRSAPPEDCGGVWAFQQQRDHTPWRAQEVFEQIADCLRHKDTTALQDRMEEIPAIQQWLSLAKFDRRQVNRRLRQYAKDDDEWRWP